MVTRRGIGGYLKQWISRGTPDRLIVCVHHPANDENAGMDLYGALHARQVSYAELDAAALEEYVYLGKRVANIENIYHSDGLPLFRP